MTIFLNSRDAINRVSTVNPHPDRTILDSIFVLDFPYALTTKDFDIKFTILPVLLLFITLPGMAQLQLAPITGLNISKIRTSKNALTGISYFNTNGFMAGLNAKYAFVDKFNLQLEGAYSQKGFETQAENVSGRFKIHLNYIDFALLGEYSINEIIALNVGGNYGIKINENINGSKGLSSDFYNGKDIGLVAGLKFYIGQLFIRTTYQHGINAIGELYTTNENGEPIENFKEFNQTFQVAVGYYFSEPYNVFKR